MILKFENDPLDSEHSGGHYYHVCQGRIQDKSAVAHTEAEKKSGNAFWGQIP